MLLPFYPFSTMFTQIFEKNEQVRRGGVKVSALRPP